MSEAPKTTLPGENSLADADPALIVNQLKWWAWKFCGKGAQEDEASDVMTQAAAEIERLRAVMRINGLFVGLSREEMEKVLYGDNHTSSKY